MHHGQRLIPLRAQHSKSSGPVYQAVNSTPLTLARVQQGAIDFFVYGPFGGHSTRLGRTGSKQGKQGRQNKQGSPGKQGKRLVPFVFILDIENHGFDGKQKPLWKTAPDD